MTNHPDLDRTPPSYYFRLPPDFGPYGIMATLGGGLGYYLHTVDNRQHELLDLLKKRILKNRERQAAKLEARAAAASETGE